MVHPVAFCLRDTEIATFYGSDVEGYQPKRIQPKLMDIGRGNAKSKNTRLPVSAAFWLRDADPGKKDRCSQ